MACALGISVLKGPGPSIFVGLLVFGYLAAPRLLGIPSAEQSRAVYATSAVFAIAHSFAWPTPIPLFCLGLVLGYLACRTQTLVAPLTVHGLFNAISCLELFLNHLAQ
jgi:membrane protease YdiL (CAAX protease family)